MASTFTIKSGYRPSYQLSIAGYKEKSQIYKSPFDILDMGEILSQIL